MHWILDEPLCAVIIDKIPIKNLVIEIRKLAGKLENS